MRGLHGFTFNELKEQLAKDYSYCQHEHQGYKLTAEDDELDALSLELAKMYEGIWRTKRMPQTINKPVAGFFADKLWSGASQGFGNTSIDYDTPDGKLLANLQKNVYQFAAAKNWQQMKDITLALIGEDNRLREYEEFKRAATEITGEHTKWLKTEYNTAVSGGQMASKWADIQRDKEILPFLQFDAVIDKHTTDLCAKLNDVILPVDDPFWKAFYPPNHFNCRSTVRQLRNGKPTDKSDIDYPEIPDMFKTNLGDQQLVFPSDSAYFKGAPAHVLADALKMLPEGNGWLTPHKYANGGKVRIHRAVDVKANDFADVLEVATFKAAAGDEIDILPTLKDNDPLIKHLFAGAMENKQPDYKINGTFAELETSTNSRNLNNLKHAVGSGSKQADYVIIKLSEKISYETMDRVAKGRFIDHKRLQTIEFYYQDEIKHFERPK